MSDELSQPGGDTVVHLLVEGRALCGIPSPPGDWGPGHKWVSGYSDDLGPRSAANCQGCLQQAVFFPTIAPHVPAPHERLPTIIDGEFPGPETELEQDWFFTFGSGHVHPVTGEPIGRRFVRFHGTHASARAKMVAAFGVKWSHQYESADDAGVSAYRYTELAVDFEKPRSPTEYLGDGVYASFDGYHIWLRADGPNAGGQNAIALEPAVLDALMQYRAGLIKGPEE